MPVELMYYNVTKLTGWQLQDCVSCFLAGGGHAAADHSGDVPFGIEKRRQRLQLLGGWEASIAVRYDSVRESHFDKQIIGMCLILHVQYI